MRNIRTVKVTYCGFIFFCDKVVVFGVGRRLGCIPSGGLLRWQANVRDGRGDQGRFPHLRIPVLIQWGTGHPVWLEPPCLRLPGPSRTRLVVIVYVLLLEGVNGIT